MPANKNTYAAFRVTQKEKTLLKLLAERMDLRLSALLRQISKDKLREEGLLI